MIWAKPNKTEGQPIQKKSVSKSSLPRRYELYISKAEILVRNKADSDNLFLLNRKDLSAKFIPFSELQNYKLEKPLSIFGVYGQVEINGVTFLIAISKARIAANLGQSLVFKIESVKFLTVNHEQYKNFDYESCWDRLERIKDFLRSGFYFSYTYRLHVNFEGHFGVDAKDLTNDFHKNAFIWNYRAIECLTKTKTLNIEIKEPGFDGNDLDLPPLTGLCLSRAESIEAENGQNDCESESSSSLYHFFFPIIQGFVGSIDLNGFKIVLISRRSRIMGGTRYNSRGCDNNGHVANFVQTEQLLILNEHVWTFNQIRGSLPFYWTQPTGLINPKTVIHQRQEINFGLLQKHLKLLLTDGFEHIVFFNLLAHKRPEEDALSRYLVLLLESIQQNVELKDRVYYEHVDFHSLTRQADFSGVDKYIYCIVERSPVGYNTFESDGSPNNFVQKSKQLGVIRTNCLDCLDRTNAVQTKFGCLMLYKILHDTNSPWLNLFKDYETGPLRAFEVDRQPLLDALRRLWADNGDAISQIYAGTGATTSAVTRKGDQSAFTSFLDHKFKSLSRFYINNFEDDFKQEIIDILSHKKSISIRQNEFFIERKKDIWSGRMKISVVTLFSVLKNNSVSISPKTLDSIFRNGRDTDIIIFITRLDRPRDVQLVSESCVTCESFSELFKTLSKHLHGFRLVEQTQEERFEISIFAAEKKPDALSFFKSEKVKLSTFGQTLGVRSSFIINNNGIEFFSLKLERSTFNYAPQQALERIFQKYLDRNYDFVFVVGYIEDVEVELENIHKGYELALQDIRKGERDGRFSSHLMLFCSKNVVEGGNQPAYSPMNVDKSFLSEELTINAHSFIINRLN